MRDGRKGAHLGDLLDLLVHLDNVPPPHRNLRRPFSYRSRQKIGNNANGRGGRGDEGVGVDVVASSAGTTGQSGRTDLFERED